MKYNILIVGTGMVGSFLKESLESYYNVTLIKKDQVGSIDIDKFNRVVFASGSSNVDDYYTNTESIFNEYKNTFQYFSEYVFYKMIYISSGDLYNESNFINYEGDGVLLASPYRKVRFDIEKLIPNATILRTRLHYSHSWDFRSNLAYRCRNFSSATIAPHSITSVYSIADSVKGIIKEGVEGGIYNVCDSEFISIYDFCKAIGLNVQSKDDGILGTSRNPVIRMSNEKISKIVKLNSVYDNIKKHF